MSVAASEKRPPSGLAERFWSIARASGESAPASGDPEEAARVVIRHVLRILDALAAGEVGDGVSQSTVSFLQLLRQSEASGDLSYASPEQARGDTLDERSLVFSVGVLIFEELTGRHPFGSSAGARRLARMQKCELGSGVQFFPQVPAQLRTVLMRAMGPFPEERYASLRELRSHLERYADGRADQTPEPRRRVALRGLPPSPADLLFGSVEDSIPTLIRKAPAAPPAQKPAARARPSSAPRPIRALPISADSQSTEIAPRKWTRTRAVAERLGWIAVGAGAALAVTLIALPRLRAPRGPVIAVASAPSVPPLPTAPTATPLPAPALEAPSVPPVAVAAAARFDAELAARNALTAVRGCFAELDHSVAFGAGLLFSPSSALSRRAYLSPDEPLDPSERRCVAKALVGVDGGGAAPERSTVPELRFRLRPDAARDEVKLVPSK